jgi:hypothetical protein
VVVEKNDPITERFFDKHYNQIEHEIVTVTHIEKTGPVTDWLSSIQYIRQTFSVSLKKLTMRNEFKFS